jgi:hypothetical protein
MAWAERARRRIKAGRKAGALWVRILDVLRLVPTAEGRARLWTRVVHWNDVHQTTPFTAEERYPELFDLAARLAPDAERILSFGCSTGEELLSIRRRFPNARIIGAEINPRSRHIAARRVRNDSGTNVVPPKWMEGSFDLIFALAVFQREPHKIDETGAQEISSHYPFERFDTGVADLVRRLRAHGLLCVTNAQYRIEDSSAAISLEAIGDAPRTDATLFGRDGRKLEDAVASSMFRNRA